MGVPPFAVVAMFMTLPLLVRCSFVFCITSVADYATLVVFYDGAICFPALMFCINYCIWASSSWLTIPSGTGC